jgi:hypothetical protein
MKIKVFEISGQSYEKYLWKNVFVTTFARKKTCCVYAKIY